VISALILFSPMPLDYLARDGSYADLPYLPPRGVGRGRGRRVLPGLVAGPRRRLHPLLRRRPGGGERRQAPRRTGRPGAADGRRRGTRRGAEVGAVARRCAVPAPLRAAAARGGAPGRRPAAGRRRPPRLPAAGLRRVDAFALFGPLLRRLDPETAHRLTLWALEHGLAPRRAKDDDPILATSV